MPRRGRTRHVVNLVDLQMDRHGDIVTDQFKIGSVQQTGDVRFLAGEKIVQTNNVVTVVDQPFAKVRTQKTGAAGDQNALNHDAVSIASPVEGRCRRGTGMVTDF